MPPEGCQREQEERSGQQDKGGNKVSKFGCIKFLFQCDPYVHRKIRELDGDIGTAAGGDDEEKVPKWIQLVQQQQQQQQQHQQQQQIQPSNKQQSQDEMPNETLNEGSKEKPMTFEESVKAMLDLMDEYENSNNKSTSITRESTIAKLKDFSHVKSLFEDGTTKCKIPSGSVANDVAIDKDKVSKAKEKLLKKDKCNKTSDTKLKEERFLSRKCSDVKNKLLEIKGKDAEKVLRL